MQNDVRGGEPRVGFGREKKSVAQRIVFAFDSNNVRGRALRPRLASNKISIIIYLR